jgi:chromosome segregation ATPase
MKDLNEEIKRLNVELETANKSIWDKERAIKQDKREIDHQDNVLRTNKTKLQEVFEQLNVKELNLKNSEKEIDNLRADIKKNELRFE